MKADLFAGLAALPAASAAPKAAVRITAQMAVRDLTDPRAHCCAICGIFTGLMRKAADGAMVFLCRDHREAV